MKSIYTKVTLPTGDEVEVPTILGNEWFESGKTGYINPAMLAPNLNQPRKFIDPAKLEELQTSVSNVGVRETIRVTPMSCAPWAEVEEEHRKKPWLIVSGHRRHISALEGGVIAVPIEVRHYKTEADFDDDASILNKNREGLSEIEEGYEFLDRNQRGEKISQIVRADGRTRPVIESRIALTRLHPDIQALISPELKTRKRLAIGMSSELGKLKPPSLVELVEKLKELGDSKTDPTLMEEDERRFCLQNAYLQFIQKKGWGGVVAVEYIRTGKIPVSKSRNGAFNRKGDVHEKKLTVRGQLLTWCTGIQKTDFLDMTPDELRKAFEYALREDLEAIVKNLKLASQDISSLAELLSKIAKDKQKTNKEVLNLSSRIEQKIT